MFNSVFSIIKEVIEQIKKVLKSAPTLHAYIHFQNENNFTGWLSVCYDKKESNTMLDIHF